MSENHEKTAQLNKSEREELEKVVTKIRGRIEDNIQYQLAERDLDKKPADPSALDQNDAEIYEAISLELVDDTSWAEGVEDYITGVGFTIVNRITAIRCLEVRGFIDKEVTVFREDGITPAADPLINKRFLLEDEAILKAYEEQCERLAAEIEILFDQESPYALVQPDVDTFRDICGLIDQISTEIWLADDVLGWVYEYYNSKNMSELRKKMRNGNLEVEDIPPANQFYTPHWVVRLLADNSLGKYYLEATDQLESVIEEQRGRDVDGRTNRPAAEAESIEELCTYLVAEDTTTANLDEFDHPREISIIDPACGSGHFLLYCFDILERIWWEECPELSKESIPERILEHNLYGVDVDLRACQLAAFNLYMKAKTRADAHARASISVSDIGIVCADADIAEIDYAENVLDEVAGGNETLRTTLQNIIDVFQTTHGLGSLLDIKSTLSEEFLRDQTKLSDDWDTVGSVNAFLNDLQTEIEATGSNGSFAAKDIKSFLRLLIILTQDYDIALMNPPYGSQRRMPAEVKSYIKDNYTYDPEYYINFFEVCDTLVTEDGRIGMLVPRSFMFSQSFEEFRSDFIGDVGSFDFVAEFGMGILDNATVRTAGTVVRTGQEATNTTGTFFRLHDVEPGEKEETFVSAAFDSEATSDIHRIYNRELSTFETIPGSHLSYWMDTELREYYDAEMVFDAENAGVEKDSVGVVKKGTTTGDNDRFLRYFWEQSGDGWVPFAKGGEDAFILPRVTQNVQWANDGAELRQFEGSVPQNTQYFFKEALTYTVAKETGRRFGYLDSEQAFDSMGSVFIPDDNVWGLLAYANSQLVHYLMLCQTPGRMWQVGMVSKLPWAPELAQDTDLPVIAKEMLGVMLAYRQTNINSPYFTGPILLQCMGEGTSLSIHQHPHRHLLDDLDDQVSPPIVDGEVTLSTLDAAADSYLQSIVDRVSELDASLNEVIYEHYGISTAQIEEIKTEIDVRTAENPYADAIDLNIESRSTEERIKDLLHYFVLKSVSEHSQGVISFTAEGSSKPLLEHVIQQFHTVFEDNADSILAAIDSTIGDLVADEDPYPNIDDWLQNDFIEYHLAAVDNTPIIWKLTSERLVSDSNTEGFACLVDFHQLDASVFDYILSELIEPRKADLRANRKAAADRLNDESLTAAEQSKYAEAREQADTGLTQVETFETILVELGKPSPREWETELQKSASKLKSLVTAFKSDLEHRLEVIDRLADHENVVMEEMFTPTFYQKVQENNDEWVKALDSLVDACEAYAKPETEPVAAHHYDLFEYFGDLIGSTHYMSNGILFMTYYFEDGTEFLEDGVPRDGLREDIALQAQLAEGLEEFKAQTDQISDLCNTLSSELPTEWSDRAANHVVTEGYSPVPKYGVQINLIPLAEEQIVPKLMTSQVVE